MDFNRATSISLHWEKVKTAVLFCLFHKNSAIISCHVRYKSCLVGIGSSLYFFFFFLLNFDVNVIELKKGKNMGKSALQAVTRTNGRVSTKKLQDTGDWIANLAVVWAAILQTRLTQTKETEMQSANHNFFCFLFFFVYVDRSGILGRTRLWTSKFVVIVSCVI